MRVEFFTVWFEVYLENSDWLFPEATTASTHQTPATRFKTQPQHPKDMTTTVLNLDPIQLPARMGKF